MSSTTTTTTETLRTGGPRTPEGKARSAMNAVKHGLSGRTLLVPESEQEDYQAFLSEWESELDPVGAVEKELFGQILTAAWTLRRISRAEADLMDESLADPLLLDSAQNKLRLYSTYQSRAERTFHRGLAELRKLQEERVLREAILPEDEMDEDSPPPSPLVRMGIIRRQYAADKRTVSKFNLAELEAALNAPPPGPPRDFAGKMAQK